MKAIIIGVGDELVSGETADTNSAYLSRQLGEIGIETLAHWTVGDRRRQIASSIARAAKSASVVLVTGGLGPTADDVTRQAMADALGKELVLDKDCLGRIEELFHRRGRTMVAANRNQAMIPAGTEPLENELGTACGIAAKLGKADVLVMPGVPHEMERMFHSAVAPRLPGKAGRILHHVIHTFGAGESDVGSRIADLMPRTGRITVGTTVAAGMVSVQITSRSDGKGQANQRIAELASEIRHRLGDLVVAEGRESMASVVGHLLRQHGQTLATAESCTGGMIGELITAVPGASDYYLGGIVAYSNEAKQTALAIPQELLASHAAVSEQVAAAMAENCHQGFASDWAISATGIAGPAGATKDKPVGLVYVALSGEDTTQVHRHVFGGNREIVRRRSALAALNYLRLALLVKRPRTSGG